MSFCGVRGGLMGGGENAWGHISTYDVTPCVPCVSDRWIAVRRISYLKLGGVMKFTRQHVEAFEQRHTVKATD